MQVPDPTTEPTVSVERTAECLGIGRSLAYEAVRSGEIPSIRVGSRIRVPTAALCRLLQGEVQDTPQPARCLGASLALQPRWAHEKTNPSRSLTKKEGRFDHP